MPSLLNLATLLAPTAVLAKITVRDRKQALKQMAVRGAELTSLSEREIYSVLMEREQLGCTGMGNGVCIPHGRFGKLDKIQAIFSTLAYPIEFGASDGRPVDIFFLLLTPAQANTEHLKALAIVSKLMRDKELCEQLRATSDAGALYELLMSADRGDEAA